MHNSTLVQPDSAAIQHFLEILYGPAEDGWLVLSYPDPTVLKPDGTPVLKSEWFDISHTTWQTIAHTAARRARTCNVYFGVALQQPNCEPGQFKRSRNSTAYSVPGFCCDIDLAYGDHAASQLPQTDDEALQFLADLPARPSLIIHSGGGLYGYWIFREPFVITSEEERETIAHLSRQFNYTLGQAGKLKGWTLDAVGDLARVLRPPGTVNRKYGKLVELIHEEHERHNIGDFDWLSRSQNQPVHSTRALALRDNRTWWRSPNTMARRSSTSRKPNSSGSTRSTVAVRGPTSM